ncbi:hypothetical protein QTP86_014996 [Hemibagrus guttatus]|nr:hypothetical protein QTP86_014996 [Hemibagrus guttatus]
MALISITCQVIFSVIGYTYPVSPNISSDVLQDQDCEQAWYRKAPGNGSVWEYLSDGQLRENQTKHKLVVAATRKNITVPECIELRHDVTCHGSNQKFQHVYQVTATSNPIIVLATINPATIAVPSIITTIIIIIGIGFLIWRERIRRRLLRDCRAAENNGSNNFQLQEIEAGSNHETGLLNSTNRKKKRMKKYRVLLRI